MTIKLRELGKTGIMVSPIGLGVMQFAGGKGVYRGMFPLIPDQVMNNIVQTALEGGINWFDTAEMYGNGHSERCLANSLETIGAADQDVLIATKWLPYLRSADNIAKTIDVRIRNLSPYQIDLHQVHNSRSFSPPEAEMNAMADLVQAGKIRSVGVSNFSSDHMRRAHAALASRGLALASNQVHYNLLNREIETNGVLDTARELGVTIIAYSPLASGLLTGKFHKSPEVLAQTPAFRRRRLEKQLESSQPVIQVLDEIAVKYDTEPAMVALSWLINKQGEIVVAIPGASRVEHVQESIGAMQLNLSNQDSVRLDEITNTFRMKE